MVQKVRDPTEEWVLQELLEEGILPLDERFRKAQQYELDLPPLVCSSLSEEEKIRLVRTGQI